MIKKFIKSIGATRKQKEISPTKTDRHLLEKKVEKGTDMVIREYRDVFIKLADYDRT